MNKNLRRFAVRPAALAAVLAVLTGSAWADPPARVGRVAWIAGDVSLSAQAGAAPVGAALNWPVTGGNVLVTSPSGRAEITIGSTAVDLDVDTQVDVEQLDDAQMRLRVERGSVAVRTADPQDAAMLGVLTPLGRFSQQQPGRLRVDVRAGAVDGTAWRGRVGFVGNDGATYTFVDGQHAHLVPAAGGLAMSLLALPADDFQRFAQAREGGPPPAAARAYVSPEMTGADTLDAYGQWSASPEYGNVWVPNVGADWAPYRYGHWAWVAPWGWTWVDNAPWGFAPFHYGRWALWQGRWAWVPGTYVARPVYAPALVAWTSPLPPAPGLTITAAVGAGFAAGVSWVPLAPREVYVPPYAVSATYVRNVNVTHVTNVTEIDNVTRIVNTQRAQGLPAAALPGRPLALAGNPRAVTTVQADVMRTHQQVFAHLAAPSVHAAMPVPAAPPDARPGAGHPEAREPGVRVPEVRVPEERAPEARRAVPPPPMSAQATEPARRPPVPAADHRPEPERRVAQVPHPAEHEAVHEGARGPVHEPAREPARERAQERAHEGEKGREHDRAASAAERP